MTFKVNYGFQKAERNRAKLAKKEAKRREKEGAPDSVKDDAAAPDDVTTDASGGEESPS